MDIQFEKTGTDGVFFIKRDQIEMAKMTIHFVDSSSFRIDHTYVNEALKGRGIAKKLLLEAVAYARREKLTIIPLCSYAAQAFEKDNSIQDVLKTADTQ